MSDITMEFARQDYCLDKMVPSDLRLLVGERDRLKEENEKLQIALAAALSSKGSVANTLKEDT